MDIRTYEPERDREAARRIWRETGWVEGKEQEETLDLFLEAGRVLVADLGGEPESLVASAPGAIRYLDEDLPFSAVTAVTTSRIARKRGLARRLTAELLARDAADGALLSVLGIFEQGFYDRLGFGSGSYDHYVSFDPAHLTVDRQPRLPTRLTKDDGAKVHAALLARHRGHGGCNLMPESLTVAEMRWAKGGFGLGYPDGPDGELAHLLWASAKDASGPYSVRAMAYRTREQFLELMALIQSWSDQVHLVRMHEPAGIQLQDLLAQPLKHRRVSRRSEFESATSAGAHWQARVLDLPGCLERTHLRGAPVRFNLALTDPVEALLPADAPWRGLAGNYVVTLGPSSGAQSGADPGLPTLTATVNAFTRLWLGVRPATGLAVTDALSAPPDLLDALDATLRLPPPQPDWEF